MSAPVAVVTGAGSGIGRCVCHRMATAGYRVALVSRDEKKLQATVEQMGRRPGAGEEVLLLPADLGDHDQAASVINLTVEQWGRLDVLINNAGVAPLADLADTDEDLLFRTFSVNTFGPAVLIATAWPHFVSAGGGRIVNVSSMATLDPFPGLGVYAASKSALESLTRSIRNEGAGHGILAFSVAPGAVETPMLRSIIDTETLPTEQALDPEEVASVIVACARGERDDQAGEIIRLPSP
ncbi:MAG: SDR family NAD(P)-dependent oxidoreductase [Planctomycetota bacterium]|jgi:NAD(P)-dependent dehydrogenase (short-subunit alcohol dehydrogenase family)